MFITFQDRAPLEKVRRLADGRIAAVAKFARSGCYTYSGHEVGRPDLASVTVYRPEDEVFSADAMASFAHKAITLDHPAEAVTPATWRQVAVGFTEGRVARDGGFIEIPLMLADAEAVHAYESGTARELSAGYGCQIDWGDGVAPDGQPYQATQRQIRGNHIALVRQGRAGSECRIGDSAMQHAAMADARIGAEIAHAKMAHDMKFAFMGDRAPPFDAEKAKLAAASVLRAAPGMAVRDAVLSARYLPDMAADRARADAARADMIRDMTAQSTGDVRDAIRDARYR